MPGLKTHAAVSSSRSVRLFAAPAGQPRGRRGTDVVLLVAALLGLAIGVVLYPPGSFERSLERFLASIPGWLDPVWGFFSDFTWFWAVLLVVLALARRRWFVVGQALAAVVIGVLAGLAAARLAIGSWPDVSDAVFGTARATRFPAVRLGEDPPVEQPQWADQVRRDREHHRRCLAKPNGREPHRSCGSEDRVGDVGP